MDIFHVIKFIISQITPIYTKYSNNNKKHGGINHSIKRYHHNILAVNVNTFTIKKMFLNLDTYFKRLRNLKEKYIEFNEQDYENKFDALSKYVDQHRKSVPNKKKRYIPIAYKSTVLYLFLSFQILTKFSDSKLPLLFR